MKHAVSPQLCNKVIRPSSVHWVAPMHGKGDGDPCSDLGNGNGSGFGKGDADEALSDANKGAAGVPRRYIAGVPPGHSSG